MGKSLRYYIAHSILCVVGFCFITIARAAAQQVPTDMVVRENSRRHLAMKDAMQQVQQARTAYAEGRYTDAVEAYRNALSVLPGGASSEKLRRFIRESLSDALIARAMDYRKVGRTEEAVAFLREAVELNPGGSRAQRELADTQDSRRNNPALTPQHIGDTEEVKRLLHLAYGYYDSAQYDAAIKTFNAVLSIDKYNEAARRGIEEVVKRQRYYYDAARNEARAESLSQVDKTWDDMTKNGMEDLPHMPAGEQPDNSENVTAAPSADEIAIAHLAENTTIPSVKMEDATIGDVLDVLQGYLRRARNDAPPNSRRFNVVGSFGTAETPGYAQLMQRRVTFSYSGISLKELLDEVAQRFELAYYYVPLGIEFTYSGKDFGRLVDCHFTVPPHFFDNEGGDEEDEDDNAMGSTIRVKRVDPVAALKRMGISFPKGATASYHAATRRLSVRNTQGNISEIKQAIADSAGHDEHQVLLSTVIVETSQEDIEDLGFEWLLNFGITDNVFSGGGTPSAAMSGMPLVTGYDGDDGGTPAPHVGELRSINAVSGKSNMESLIERGSVREYQTSRPDSSSPSVFGFRGIWKTADVTMIMRGLSQKGAIDKLSTPKLIFTPGREEQASIVNVREMYYPTNYDPPQITSSGNNWVNFEDGNNNDGNNGFAMAAAAHPTDFVRYGVVDDTVGGIGAIMQVHNAEVMQDGRHVRLALTTIMNDFEGFVDWGSPIYTALYTQSRIQRIELTPNHILQPIFKRYLTNTSLVVQDGAVLVMGGMKEAKVVTYEDKIPLLGDLPLVGRFFRSEGSKRKRRVLLIFAKVNILSPAGADYETGGEGAPENDVLF